MDEDPALDLVDVRARSSLAIALFTSAAVSDQQAWQHMHKAARARDKLGHTSEIKDWAGAVEVVNAWQQESQQLTAVLRRS